MAPKAVLTVPTSATLPSSLRLPSSHPAVSKPVSRLARPSLLSLAQEWLKASNQATCGPVLGEYEGDDNNSIYDVAQTLDELRELYAELGARGGSRREVVDRVLEGDWRNGLSLRQLAMVDLQYLLDHPKSQRWTARKLVRVTAPLTERRNENVNRGSRAGFELKPAARDDELPRFHAPTFLRRLQGEVGSLVKAHYHLTRLSSLPISLLRIYIHESPYNTRQALISERYNSRVNANSVQDVSKTLFVAFPDHAPFVYISSVAPQSIHPATSDHHAPRSEAATIRKTIIDAIPKAFSRNREHYALQPTSLTARNLSALSAARGPGTGNAANGGWSIFAEGSVDKSPLTALSPVQKEEEEDDEEGAEIGHSARTAGDRIGSTTAAGKNKRPLSEVSSNSVKEDQDPALLKRQKQCKQLARVRFGHTGIPTDGRGIERFEVQVEDLFTPPSTSSPNTTTTTTSNDAPPIPPDWRPRIQLTFHGTHVFAGIRSLVESGVVDGRRMPGWMSGEEGVSIGVVRDGVLMGRKGAG